jgi:phage regulator Rha-like protein
MSNSLTIIPSERIVSKIYIIRNRKVMIDRDLAGLYGVTTGNLNLAVRRNIKRFPEDFMFQMTKEEMKNWILQFATSNSTKMGLRKSPYVFTEQGVAMLSSVLNSDRAINVNIQIIRTFTKIRELLATNEALQRKMIEMEKKYDGKIKEIFDTLGFLLEDKIKPKKQIGFK